MANFRIDEIELNRTGDDIYNAVIITNADKTGDYVIDATVSGRELIFDPGTLPGNKRITFRCNIVDFSDYRELDDGILSICILDHSTIPALKRKKGGVVVVDTEYPPPGGGAVVPFHQEFSGRFTITRLFIQRIGTSNEFTIDVTFDYDHDKADYIKNSFEFKTDPIREDQDVLIFNVNEGDPSEYSIPFTFSVTSGDDKPLELMNYSPGLPLIILKKGTTWTEQIDMKKGMVFIE